MHYNRVKAERQEDIPLNYSEYENKYMSKETPVSQQKIHSHIDVNDMEWLSSWLKVKAMTN